jgi:hypothetical protein
MTQRLSPASRWRTELAATLSKAYGERDPVKMIVLGGSPARNMSDAYSDLDIVVYWDEIDYTWLEKIPLRELNCRRELMRKADDEKSCLESYYFDTLKVDFGHLTFEMWEQLTDDVTKRFSTDPDMHGTIEGFLASKALYGGKLVEEWKGRLSVYPDELAREVVKRYALFFHRGVLDHQALDRGDIFYFYFGLCKMLQNLIGVLAGLNRIYLSPEEPRWTEYELSRMRLRPEDAWNRVKSIFEVDRAKATGILEGLIDDVFDLVQKHMPDVDVSMRRHRFNLTVKPTDSPPNILRRG